MLLLVLCAMTGFVMVVGGVLAIWKGKILIDRQTREAIQVELPWKGLKLKGLTPALFYFVLGCAMVVIPVGYVYHQPHANVTGEVSTAGGAALIVYVAANPAVVEGQATTYSLRVPFSSAVDTYDVLYVANGQVLSHLRVPAPSASGATVRVAKTVELQ